MSKNSLNSLLYLLLFNPKDGNQKGTIEVEETTIDIIEEYQLPDMNGATVKDANPDIALLSDGRAYMWYHWYGNFNITYTIQLDEKKSGLSRHGYLAYSNNKIYNIDNGDEMTEDVSNNITALDNTSYGPCYIFTTHGLYEMTKSEFFIKYKNVKTAFEGMFINPNTNQLCKIVFSELITSNSILPTSYYHVNLSYLCNVFCVKRGNLTEVILLPYAFDSNVAKCETAFTYPFHVYNAESRPLDNTERTANCVIYISTNKGLFLYYTMTRKLYHVSNIKGEVIYAGRTLNYMMGDKSDVTMKVIVTKDGHIYRFKAINTPEWIEKNGESFDNR